MSTNAARVNENARFVGNDRVLFGIIFGVLAFWLFAQTTLNISPAMAQDLGIGTSVMNIAVSITALFGGLMVEHASWRWIFFAAAAISALGMFMVAGTPESKAEASGKYSFDTAGVLTFMVMMVALQVLATQGGQLGWTSLPTLALLVVSVIFGVLFFRIESGNPNGFVDFNLFRNMTYTGATISNFLLNATAGILIVAMMLVQAGGGMTAQAAGFLTIGYAVAIVAFIRVGEKLLQRFGPRRPMIWGSLIVGAAIACLLPTNLTLHAYRYLAIVGFTLFGLGLAFYATPSTDAALSALPDDQAGSGAGIYKMASSLGASFGVAISATVFTMLSGGSRPVAWTEGVISYLGRQDNLAVREAALVALAINLLMVIAAIVSIMLTIPRRKVSESSAAKESPRAPAVAARST